MKTITLIDDNHTDIQLFTIWFENSGLYKVVKHYYSGLDAIRKMAVGESDLCLIDTRMPSLNGIETTLLLLQKGYLGKIVGFSHAYYHEDMLNSKAAGAHGYCGKDRRSIFATLNKIENETNFYDNEYYQHWHNNTENQKLHLKDEDSRKELLNPHFRKILFYSSKGLSTAAMSELMGLKKHTVEQYRASMLQQLEFKSIGQAIAWAIATNIVSQGEILAPPPPLKSLLNEIFPILLLTRPQRF